MTQFRPTGFQILPTIVKNLLIINGLVYLAQSTIPASVVNFDDLFALHTAQSELFKPWQLITHLFMHGSLDHIFSNMFALWMFGAVLENYWGPKRFLTFYLICGLGAALCHMGVLYFESQNMINEYNRLAAGNASMDALKEFIDKNNVSVTNGYYDISTAYRVLQGALNVPTLGASGAVFGCLAAFGYLFPNTYIYLYLFLPVKAKWFVLAYAAFELYAGLQNSAGDDIAHFAHLGGALAGILLVYYWNKNQRNTLY